MRGCVRQTRTVTEDIREKNVGGEKVMEIWSGSNGNTSIDAFLQDERRQIHFKVHKANDRKKQMTVIRKRTITTGS